MISHHLSVMFRYSWSICASVAHTCWIISKVSVEDLLSLTQNLMFALCTSLQSMMKSQMSMRTWSQNLSWHSSQHNQQICWCPLQLIHLNAACWCAVEQDLKLLGATLCNTDLSVPHKLVCTVVLSSAVTKSTFHVYKCNGNEYMESCIAIHWELHQDQEQRMWWIETIVWYRFLLWNILYNVTSLLMTTVHWLRKLLVKTNHKSQEKINFIYIFLYIFVIVCVPCDSSPMSWCNLLWVFTMSLKIIWEVVHTWSLCM